MNKTPIFYYPIFLNVKDRPVIVIGGGRVASRKIRTLLQAGANITVISPKLNSALLDMEKRQQIKIRHRPYQQGDLQDAFLVFTATDKTGVNQAVAEEAKEAGICINVADRSTPGDFIVPAIFSEKELTVAVSTHGENPTVAVATRDRLKKYLRSKP